MAKQRLLVIFVSLNSLLRRHAGRLARFGLVGFVGTLVNTGLLATLVEVWGWNKVAGAIIATEAAILVNFTLNDRWTFRGARTRRSWPARAVRYNVVALGGLLVSIVVLAILTHLGGMYYLFANLIAILSATVWNYCANARITWRLAPSPRAVDIHSSSPLLGSAKELLPPRSKRSEA